VASDDPRARLNFSEPEQQLPAPKPAPAPAPAIEQTTAPTESVKTPTLLEVHRIQQNPNLIPPDTSKTGIHSMLQRLGAEYRIDSDLAMAVVQAESNFDSKAVSTDGFASKGLFQLLDSTGKDLLARGSQPNRDYDPFNPEMNAELGTSYLRYLHDLFGTKTKLPNSETTRPAANADSLEKLAVAAFNAGEGRVAMAQRRAETQGKDPTVYNDVEPFLPKSTQEYVRKVVANKLDRKL